MSFMQTVEGGTIKNKSLRCIMFIFLSAMAMNLFCFETGTMYHFHTGLVQKNNFRFSEIFFSPVFYQLFLNQVNYAPQETHMIF